MSTKPLSNIPYDSPNYKLFTKIQVVSSIILTISLIAFAAILAFNWHLTTFSLTLHSCILFGTPTGTAFISLVTLGITTYLKNRSRSKPVESAAKPSKNESISQINSKEAPGSADKVAGKRDSSLPPKETVILPIKDQSPPVVITILSEIVDTAITVIDLKTSEKRLAVELDVDLSPTRELPVLTYRSPSALLNGEFISTQMRPNTHFNHLNAPSKYAKLVVIDEISSPLESDLDDSRVTVIDEKEFVEESPSVTEQAQPVTTLHSQSLEMTVYYDPYEVLKAPKSNPSNFELPRIYLNPALKLPNINLLYVLRGRFTHEICHQETSPPSRDSSEVSKVSDLDESDTQMALTEESTTTALSSQSLALIVYVPPESMHRTATLTKPNTSYELLLPIYNHITNRILELSLQKTIYSLPRALPIYIVLSPSSSTTMLNPQPPATIDYAPLSERNVNKSETTLSDAVNNIDDDDDDERALLNYIANLPSSTTVLCPSVSAIVITPPLSPIEHIQSYFKFLGPIYDKLTDFVLALYLQQTIYLDKKLKDISKNPSKFKVEVKIAELRAYFTNIWKILAGTIEKTQLINDLISDAFVFEQFKCKLIQLITNNDKLLLSFFTKDLLKHPDSANFNKSILSLLDDLLKANNSLSETEITFVQLFFEKIVATGKTDAFIKFVECISRMSIEMSNSKNTTVKKIWTELESTKLTSKDQKITSFPLIDALPEQFKSFKKELSAYVKLSQEKQIKKADDLHKVLINCALNYAYTHNKGPLFSEFLLETLNSSDQLLPPNLIGVVEGMVESSKSWKQVKVESEVMDRETYDIITTIFDFLSAFFNPSLTLRESQQKIMEMFRKQERPEIAQAEIDLSMKFKQNIILCGPYNIPQGFKVHSDALKDYKMTYEQKLKDKLTDSLIPYAYYGPFDFASIKFSQSHNSIKKGSLKILFGNVSLNTLNSAIKKLSGFDLHSFIQPFVLTSSASHQIMDSISKIIPLIIPPMLDVTLDIKNEFDKNFHPIVQDILMPEIKRLQDSQQPINNLEELQTTICETLQKSINLLDPANLLA